MVLIQKCAPPTPNIMHTVIIRKCITDLCGKMSRGLRTRLLKCLSLSSSPLLPLLLFSCCSHCSQFRSYGESGASQGCKARGLGKGFPCHSHQQHRRHCQDVCLHLGKVYVWEKNWGKRGRGRLHHFTSVLLMHSALQSTTIRAWVGGREAATWIIFDVQCFNGFLNV